MGVSIHTISGPLDDERQGELVYDGGLLVFKDVAPLREVARLAEELIGEAVRSASCRRASSATSG